MASSAFLTVPLCLLFCIVSLHVSATPVLEDGYTVVTIIDGHKLNINPHSVLQLPGSSDLIILDSANSALYTVQFPTFQDSVVKSFSGSGSGYSDGGLGSAQFNQPRSFAADLNGNVYVADRTNHVIRKISRSGVTTIAGGFSRKEGRTDGPAQNATFSNDFELAFIPSRCILLVSDHGNRLVRQISLKKEDCTPPPSGLGAIPAWTLGLGFGLLFLCVIYFVAVLPCINSRTARLEGRPGHRDMEALPNQSGEDSSDTLLRHQKRNCWQVTSSKPCNEQRPLIDLDSYSCEVTQPSKYDDQLRDLIDAERIGAGNVDKDGDVGFGEAVLLQESSVCNYGLVKRL